MGDIEIIAAAAAGSPLKKALEKADPRLLGGHTAQIKERSEFPENSPLRLMTSLSRDVLQTAPGHQHNLDSV